MTESPLREQLQSGGAQFASVHGVEAPARFGSVEQEYWALKEAAGLVDLSQRGRLRVSGGDAPRFLHGLVTNEVQELKPGQGNYTFFTDVHGHILADAHIFRLEENSFRVELGRERAEAIRAHIEHYIIADDVEVVDEGASVACLGVEGPCALEVVREAIGFDPPNMVPYEHMELPDLDIRLSRMCVSGEPGYWIWAAPERIPGIWESSVEAGAAIGVRPVGWEAVDICRIEAGLPWFGVDMNEKTLPQETGQMQAINFSKGCYLGQEVVERIRSRGHVNRQLVGLLFQGAQEVSPGAEIVVAGAGAGVVTSAAYSFGLRRTIGLGTLRREHAAVGTGVSVGALDAVVARLPFFYPTARF